MSGSNRGRALALTAVALLCTQCSAGGENERPEVAAVPPVAESLQSSAVASPYGGDIGRLRAEGPEEVVLVRSGEAPFITVGQYNDWLGSYPLNITSADPAEARMQAIDQMVTFKLIVQKARERGYANRSESRGASADDRALAMSFIQEWVTNVALVSDEEAREYEARDAERFADLDSPELPVQLKMMAVRGSVRGEQLVAQVEIWKRESEIQ